jgi:hypothetical protein
MTKTNNSGPQRIIRGKKGETKDSPKKISMQKPRKIIER